jgi:outer membrane protein TolC
MLYAGPLPVCRFVVLVLMPAALAAQEPPAGLTLREALARAREYNPDLRRAANELERTAAGERAGWGAFLPELWSETSVVDFSSRTLTARNEFGQPVALDDPIEFSAASARTTVAAALTLFDGFRRVSELRAARAESRGATAVRNAEWRRIEAEVQRRFYAALGADRMLQVEERLLAAARERLAATEAMVRAGRATPQDVLGAEVDLARQQMALENAEADAYLARLSLHEVLGGGAAVLALAGQFPEIRDPAALDAQELVAAALAASPRIRRAEATADRARHLSGATRALRWPTIRLNAGVSREISMSAPDQLTSFPWNRGTFLGLSVSLPLFTGFAASAQTADARAAEANANEDLRKTRLAVERDVRTAHTETGKAHRSVRLAQRAAELSRRRRDVGQEGFRRGLISFTELQQLIEQAAQAERAAVRARMEYARAIATLNEAVGTEVIPVEAAEERR